MSASGEDFWDLTEEEKGRVVSLCVGELGRYGLAAREKYLCTDGKRRALSAATIAYIYKERTGDCASLSSSYRRTSKSD